MSSVEEEWRHIVDGVDERWRPVPGDTMYEVSDCGRVRSWADWPGRTHPLPHILRGQNRNGQVIFQFGPDQRRHVLSDLMHQVWGASNVLPFCPRPLRFRRVMLTPRQHGQIVRVLELIDSDIARHLLVPVRRARRVLFDDLINPGELAIEDQG